MVQIQTSVRVGDMPKSDPVPEGTYHIRSEKVTLKKTGTNAKNPGAPMAEVQFTVFGPDDAEEFIGRKLFENLMLDGAGMFRLRQFLEATGEADDFVLDDTDQLADRECGAIVTVEPERKGDDGKVYSARNAIKKFIPIQ